MFFGAYSVRGGHVYVKRRVHASAVPAVTMPYLSRRILVSLCPLVNLDLFKKGYYHVACKLLDNQAEQTHSKVSCLEVKDLLGPSLTDFTFPGACIVEGQFITQTVFVEYTDQSFLMGESFVFKSDMPIQVDYTEVYVPSHFTLQLNLMFSGSDDMPEDPSQFTKVSTRNVTLNVDWRKGLHDHYPVIFDYFHMAAVGVTVYATLQKFCIDDFPIERPVQTSSRRWPFHSQHSIPEFPNFAAVLFGVNGHSSGGKLSQYEVPTARIQRAQDAHQMLCDVLRSARDSLHIGYAIMSGERSTASAVPEAGSITVAGSLEEAEEMCRKQLSDLNTSLESAWEWFCRSAIVHPQMINYLACRSHNTKMTYLRDTVVSPENPNFKKVSNITDPICQATVAAKIRKALQIPLLFYCTENVETQFNSSVLFIEPCPWATMSEGAHQPTRALATSMQAEASTRHVRPFLLNSLPHSDRQRNPGVHLVVCVHGLQGNQFDLRLYRIFLQLALPQVRFDFLMAQSNQKDTFCDFNVMTSNILDEILEYIADMPTAPSKISFIGHSLGNIVIRSLMTRPGFAHLQHKLHLFLSICGPHLGTRFQNGLVSMGMWAVRKWYSSKSLLQLSLKDAPDPRDSFLYHLSESPTFECFRHIVLLSSPQDKYVPYHSAKIATVSRDGSLQSSLSLEMMQNILGRLREARVNLVRVSVDHNLPTSANSVIGRAAHIAMLDSELFIEKFVSQHIAQYFVES